MNLEKVVKKQSMKTLKGKVLKPFEYTLIIEDFVKTKNFKATKNKAFLAALSLICFGILLPVFVGFITSINQLGEEFFRVIFVSNCIISLIFCLPLSLVIIWSSLPLYKAIIQRYLEKYGFVMIQKSIENSAA